MKGVIGLWLAFGGLVAALCLCLSVLAGTALVVFEIAVLIFAEHGHDVGNTLVARTQWQTVDHHDELSGLRQLVRVQTRPPGHSPTRLLAPLATR